MENSSGAHVHWVYTKKIECMVYTLHRYVLYSFTVVLCNADKYSAFGQIQHRRHNGYRTFQCVQEFLQTWLCSTESVQVEKISSKYFQIKFEEKKNFRSRLI